MKIRAGPPAHAHFAAAEARVTEFERVLRERTELLMLDARELLLHSLGGETKAPGQEFIHQPTEAPPGQEGGSTE